MNPVTVSTHHVSITAPIKTYAEDKLGKLDKFFDSIQEVAVELEHHEAADDEKRCMASIVVRVPGTLITAKTTSKDMYAAIDALVEKTSTQLKKHKDKLRSPKRTDTKRDVVDTDTSSEKAPKKAGSSTASTKPIYEKKPLSLEDATSLLDETGAPFLIFRNMTSQHISVLYPTGKGKFELIETD